MLGNKGQCCVRVRKEMKWALWVLYLIVFRKLPGLMVRKVNPRRTRQTPKLCRWSWDPEESMVAYSSQDRVPERKELRRKNSGICRSSPWNNPLSVDQYMCVRKLPEATERTKPRILPIITKLENLAWFMGHWVEYSQGSCLRSREYLVQDEHCSASLKKISWKQSWKGLDCFQLNQLGCQKKSKNIYMNAKKEKKIQYLLR